MMNAVLEMPPEVAPDVQTKKKRKAEKPTPDVKPLIKQLEQMRKLGEAIRAEDSQRAKQETVVAEAKAKLEGERELLHEHEHTLEELHNDLARLSVGGFVDRLPFATVTGDVSPAAPANGQAAPSSPDAWKSVPLADVWREAGANVALLALLADGKIKAGPRKGQVAEIRTLGDLAAFTSNPHAKLTDISGIGEGKDSVISDAVLKYWQKHPQAKSIDVSKSDKNGVAPLDWKPMSDTQHFADTRTIKAVEGKSTPQFVVSKAGDKWDVAQSSGCLMPAEDPGSFETIGEAKAWCEKREADLGAKAEYAPLVWKLDGKDWWANNTAGVRDQNEEEELPGTFYATEHGEEDGQFAVDQSNEDLLPIKFPDSFPTIDAAKAYCEARNRALCEKAREQMPELYEHNELPELTDKPAKKVKKPKASKKSPPKKKTTVKK